MESESFDYQREPYSTTRLAVELLGSRGKRKDSDDAAHAAAPLDGPWADASPSRSLFSIYSHVAYVCVPSKKGARAYSADILDRSYDVVAGLDPEIAELRQTVHKFLKTELAPRAAQVDKDNAFPMVRRQIATTNAI